VSTDPENLVVWSSIFCHNRSLKGRLKGQVASAEHVALPALQRSRAAETFVGAITDISLN